ncbi:MAG: 16S rRNA (cytosine(1402)-N(4))-methyltransferase RsmH [Chloroflexota bacterium]
MDYSSGESNLPHHPVLYQQIITAIQPASGGIYIDGTLGAGGHAAGILTHSQPDGRLLGLDVDPVALEIAAQSLAGFEDRAILAQASYTEMQEQASAIGWLQVNGIVLDLGASSMQFDTAERGFSFLHDGPLDMRFDPTLPITAADIVNHWNAVEIADGLYKYGEEKRSRQIARAIVEHRPIESTRQLASLIKKIAKQSKKIRLHPATRTFQALRIMVNHELDRIGQVLPIAIDLLVPGGRLAVISFHSLEDRIVKNVFRDASKVLRDEVHPMAPEIRPALVKLVTRKPIIPEEEEVAENPRARSAKLRVIEKL